jgi:hypothetical protein
VSALAATLPVAPNPSGWRVGRAFVHPAFDLLVIGSGLSLALTPFVFWGGSAEPLAAFLQRWMAPLVLLSNNAHFASSTVRLYSKPQSTRDLPFLTLGFPLLTLAVLTLSIAFADRLGGPLQTLYLTWSPFHYAAQAYGLTLMYAYRSGCTPTAVDKRLTRAACLMPFLVTILGQPSLLGTSWLGPRLALIKVLSVASFVLPALISLRLARGGRGALPLVSLLVLFSNAVWLVMLGRTGAFVWATIFHGLQYLGIVTIFHVKDRLRQPDNTHGWAWHTAGFYLACLAFGYVIFEIWPFAYVLMGFGVAESMLLVAAVINIHHFVVDAYIWKLRQAPNYRIVTDGV